MSRGGDTLSLSSDGNPGQYSPHGMALSLYNNTTNVQITYKCYFCFTRLGIFTFGFPAATMLELCMLPLPTPPALDMLLYFAYPCIEELLLLWKIPLPPLLDSGTGPPVMLRFPIPEIMIS